MKEGEREGWVEGGRAREEDGVREEEREREGRNEGGRERRTE